MQVLKINNLSFVAPHGVYEFEAIQKSTFEVDVVIYADFSAAMESDNLEDTMDYQAIYSIIASNMQQRVKLIEHLSKKIGDAIQQNFPKIESLEIRIRKLSPPIPNAKLHSTEFIYKYSRN